MNACDQQEKEYEGKRSSTISNASKENCSPHMKKVQETAEKPLSNPTKETSHASYPQPSETSQCPDVHLVDHHLVSKKI